MGKNEVNSKRQYISQADIPMYTLEQALRIPRAIIENYAGRATRPLNVAQAMNMSPNSGPFRSLCGAAIAYGLTDGGVNASAISVLPLAKRIITPTAEGDDIVARRTAFMTPRIPKDFLQNYDGQRLPRPNIAINVIAEMGVPRDRAQNTFDIVVLGAQIEGLLKEIKGERYVDLSGTVIPATQPSDESSSPAEDDENVPVDLPPNTKEMLAEVSRKEFSQPAAKIKSRVFISHGKNRAFIESLKEVASLSELEPVVSIENESAAISISDKVLTDMRDCGGAIIHIDGEIQGLGDKATPILNPNVLIEIGAALALYGKRYIVLCRKGIDLPSNLQGLYRIDYEGPILSADDTIRLLKALKHLKSIELPGSEPK